MISPCKATARQAGFTILELLVVLAIMGLLLGLSPALFKGLESYRRQAALKQIIAILKESRAQAIDEDRETDILIDTADDTIKTGDNTVTLPALAGNIVITTPSHETENTQHHIRFFADGSSTGARIEIGERYRIIVKWLSGQIIFEDMNAQF